MICFILYPQVYQVQYRFRPMGSHLYFKPRRSNFWCSIFRYFTGSKWKLNILNRWFAWNSCSYDILISQFHIFNDYCITRTRKSHVSYESCPSAKIQSSQRYYFFINAKSCFTNICFIFLARWHCHSALHLCRVSRRSAAWLHRGLGRADCTLSPWAKSCLLFREQRNWVDCKIQLYNLLLESTLITEKKLYCKLLEDRNQRLAVETLPFERQLALLLKFTSFWMHLKCYPALYPQYSWRRVYHISLSFEDFFACMSVTSWGRK